MSKRLPFIAVGSASIALLVGTCSGIPAGAASSAPGVTSNTITIGFISDLTGPAASSFYDSAGGIQARVALQNAHGGINGRKIKIVVKDDATNPTTEEDAATELASSNIFGVVEDSGVAFAGSKVLQQAGVPVTGNGFDGPEWGQKPNTNMFSVTPVNTTYDGQYYAWNWFGPFMKSIGVTKVAGLSYAQTPSSNGSIDTALAGLKSSGISTCYNDKSVPLGGTDFTASALAIKSSGCNGVLVAFEDNSDISLAQEVKDTGSDAKTVIWGTGYDNAVLASPASASALNGQYVDAIVNFTKPNPATQVMLNALKKYDTQYKGGIPDFGTWNAYLGADLMIKGLELAGKNPTRTSFISNLRKVTSYNAEGILPGSVSFSPKAFGTKAMLPKTYCNYFLQVVNDKYVETNHNKPWCGPLVGSPG